MLTLFLTEKSDHQGTLVVLGDTKTKLEDKEKDYKQKEEEAAVSKCKCKNMRKSSYFKHTISKKL